VIESDLLSGVREQLLSPAAIKEFRARLIKRIAERNRPAPTNAKRIAELEAQVGNLADAIASGALKSSPALAARLASAEAELERLRQDATPRETIKVDRLIPKIEEGFRELVADLPNALKRDLDRARATLRRYVGSSIRVESDGKTVRFMSESRRMEAEFLAVAGSYSALQTTVVAGARYATFLALRNPCGSSRFYSGPARRVNAERGLTIPT
jgi:hypothetical protein